MLKGSGSIEKLRRMESQEPLRICAFGKLTSHYPGWYTGSELLAYFVLQGICGDNNWSVRVV
jgi:hypothetical protein